MVCAGIAVEGEAGASVAAGDEEEGVVVAVVVWEPVGGGVAVGGAGVGVVVGKIGAGIVVVAAGAAVVAAAVVVVAVVVVVVVVVAAAAVAAASAPIDSEQSPVRVGMVCLDLHEEMQTYPTPPSSGLSATAITLMSVSYLIASYSGSSN